MEESVFMARMSYCLATDGAATAATAAAAAAAPPPPPPGGSATKTCFHFSLQEIEKMKKSISMGRVPPF